MGITCDLLDVALPAYVEGGERGRNTAGQLEPGEPEAGIGLVRPAGSKVVVVTAAILPVGHGGARFIGLMRWPLEERDQGAPTGGNPVGDAGIGPLAEAERGQRQAGVIGRVLVGRSEDAVAVGGVSGLLRQQPSDGVLHLRLPGRAEGGVIALISHPIGDQRERGLRDGIVVAKAAVGVLPGVEIGNALFHGGIDIQRARWRERIRRQPAQRNPQRYPESRQDGSKPFHAPFPFSIKLRVSGSSTPQSAGDRT